MSSIAISRLRYYGLMAAALISPNAEAIAESPVRYQRPSVEILKVLDAPQPPTVIFTSARAT